MRKIVKYSIDSWTNSFEMPRGATLCHAMIQRGVPRILMWVDPDAPAETRHFELAETGVDIAVGLEYVGSVTENYDGDVKVIHILERVGGHTNRQHYWQHPIVPENSPVPPVERLLLLFWRYLSGDHRVSAMAQAKIINIGAAPKPIPQTMEGSLIRAASRENLAVLWDIIVGHVPDPKPITAVGQNPFTKQAA